MLLRPDAFLILEAASARGFALHLLTNGWLLTESRAERLIRLEPRIVQVSLDGAQTGTHDFLRGRTGFGERVEAGLLRLALARRRHGAKTRIVVSAVIFHQNLAELGALVRKSIELGADEIKFQPIEQTYLEPEDPCWRERSPLWIRDRDESDRALDELVLLKRQGWPIQNSVEHLEYMKMYFREPSSTYAKVRSHDQQFKSRDCRAAVSDFEVASNGDVRLCYRMAPIGNLRRQDPARIWAERPRCWTTACPFLHHPPPVA
jgi:MoaA/NifB/PqqE/SkfB family radical SAM enzyme